MTFKHVAIEDLVSYGDIIVIHKTESAFWANMIICIRSGPTHIFAQHGSRRDILLSTSSLEEMLLKLCISFPHHHIIECTSQGFHFSGDYGYANLLSPHIKMHEVTA